MKPGVDTLGRHGCVHAVSLHVHDPERGGMRDRVPPRCDPAHDALWCRTPFTPDRARQLHMREVLKGALECVGKCPNCAPDSSCYGCLRNYWNQPFHSVLQRGIAAEFLANLITRLYPA
jgi:hypothetical protein